MIFTMQGSQYLYGTKYESKTDKIGTKFKYEILVNPQKSFGQIINNLIATQGRLTIKTNWDLNWKVKQFVVDNYGNRYIIEDIEIMPIEINQQVLAISMKNLDTNFVLSLVQIENAWGLK